MAGRKYNQGSYRYGFNGKEEDKEWGSQMIQDYGFRIYNPTIGKFLSVDPLAPDYPWYSPYQFAGNKPIVAIDLDGLEPLEQIRTQSKNKPTLSQLRNLYIERALSASTNAYNQFGINGELRDITVVLNEEKYQKYMESIDNFQYYLGIFRKRGRDLSDWALTRYLEGEGGYDIIDINDIGDRFQRRINRKVKQQVKAEFSSKSSQFVEKQESSFFIYAPKGQAAAFFSDFGTAFGSSAVKAKVDIKKLNEETFTGIMYVTFVDTYRWDPERKTPLSPGNHRKMDLLREIGASNFSIRGYYIIEFTAKKRWIGKGWKIKYEVTEVNTGETENHPEISPNASYKREPGSLIEDHTQNADAEEN